MPTILVIDDDVDFQELTRMTFRRSGLSFRIIEATDGKAALRLLAEPGFTADLILLDLNMPRMNGSEFLEAYGINTQATTPVVVLTGSDDSSDRVKSMAHSCVKEHFVKPLTVGDVMELAELMDQLKAS